MADFKAIETQEELDRIVTERLKREQEKYSDYEALKTRNSELETEVGIQWSRRTNQGAHQ